MGHPRTSHAPHLEPADESVAVAVERVTPGGGVVAAYEAFHEEVFSFLCSATRDRDVAEDLLQEVYLRLLREERAGRTPEAVRPWLYRVASNLVIDRGRRLATGRRWLERLATRDTADSPEIGILRHELAEDLERALASVSPEARIALLMSGHGFSGEEIAAAIGRSYLATRSLMCRARVTLRQRLEAEGAAR